jgi:hypothetical protein
MTTAGRTFTLNEGDRATSFYIRSNGDVSVSDRDRGWIRFRIAADDGDTKWGLLFKVMTGMSRADERLIRI